MSARDLLQGFKDKIETDSQIAESDVLVTPLIANQDSAEATVLIPVDGVVKMMRIVVREVGVYHGLAG